MKTILDQAFSKMEAASDDTSARMNFYETLLMTELFLALDGPVLDGKITPKTFPLESGDTVLAFDHETRMAAFLGETVDYLTVSGRQLVRMLQGQNLALGLNLGEAPSATLLPAEALDWMVEIAGNSAEAAERKPLEFKTPFSLPQGLAQALDRKFAASAGLADRAMLADVTYEGGETGVLLAIVDALPAAEAALRQAIGEAVSFHAEEVSLDVVFMTSDSPAIGPLSRAGLQFDFPQTETAKTIAAPGTDPDRPPKLR